MSGVLNPRVLGAVVLLAAAGALAYYGQPDLQQKWQHIAAEFEPRLLQRKVQIDPGELLDLMNDDYIELLIYDVRQESDWNIFHLVDSERVTLASLASHRKRLRNLPENAVVVVVSNDEILSTEAWKRLVALAKPNAYILEGGLNYWLDVYSGKDIISQYNGAQGSLRHTFGLALGKRHPAARPDEYHAPKREYTPKVRLLKTIEKAKGCG